MELRLLAILNGDPMGLGERRAADQFGIPKPSSRLRPRQSQFHRAVHSPRLFQGELLHTAHRVVFVPPSPLSARNFTGQGKCRLPPPGTVIIAQISSAIQGRKSDHRAEACQFGFLLV